MSCPPTDMTSRERVLTALTRQTTGPRAAPALRGGDRLHSAGGTSPRRTLPSANAAGILRHGHHRGDTRAHHAAAREICPLASRTVPPRTGRRRSGRVGREVAGGRIPSLRRDRIPVARNRRLETDRGIPLARPRPALPLRKAAPARGRASCRGLGRGGVSPAPSSNSPGISAAWRIS